MAAASETNPPIARLTPLADVLALIDAQVRPVAPRNVAPRRALQATLAADVTAPAQPGAPLALIDGWALAADATRDAGGYAPAPLAQLPPRVEAGQAMPSGTDSVAPLDAVKVTDGRAEALAPVNPGEGVLPAGGDCDPAQPLRRAGEHLRAVDLAALTCARRDRGQRARAARCASCRCAPTRSSCSAARLIAADAGAAAARRGSTMADGDVERRVFRRERRRRHRHRRHRQWPQRQQRAPAGARGPASACTASR